MISLRKTADDLARKDELIRSANEYYSRIIRTCGETAVEFEPRAAAELREEIYSLEAQFKRSSAAPEFALAYEFLRKRLETYRNLGGERIGRMREDLKSATDAMKVFADGVSVTAADYELRLRQEVQRLDSLSGSDNLNQIRTGIKEVSAAILESHEQLDRSNRLVISQLRDEIRTLHNAMGAERQRRLTDPTSGVWTRQAIKERMDVLLANSLPFYVLAVGINNWNRIQGQHSQNARQAALRAFLAELRKFLGENPTIGRWSEQLYLGVIQGSPASALSISGDLKKKLPKTYTVPDGTMIYTVQLDASIGVVDRREGIDSARFYVKLGQLTDTLA
jgi:GGDEF domain-containing protein